MRLLARILTIVAIFVTGLTLSAAPASAATSIRYSVGTAGSVSTDVGAFAVHVGQTLDSPAGWSLGGSIDFVPVSSGANVRILLASPSTIGRFAGCSSSYSCHVSGTVYINETRWNNGAPGWGGDLDSYRHYVVNHEVGHYLGLGHASCPGAGAAAPVMMQQTISTAPCRNQVWPLAGEKQAVARRYGVAVSSPSHRFAQAAHQRLVHRAATPAQAQWIADRLDNGTATRTAIVASLVTSAEYDAVSRSIARLYYAAFQRAPDPSGIVYWGRAVANGYPVAFVAADFARSRELRLRYDDLDDSRFVDRLYVNTLGRRADASGHRYWTGLLASGALQRGDVLHYFAQSPEHRTRRDIDADVALYYALLLDTSGDPSGVRYWTSQIRSGAGVAEVVAVFLASGKSVL